MMKLNWNRDFARGFDILAEELLAVAQKHKYRCIAVGLIPSEGYLVPCEIGMDEDQLLFICGNRINETFETSWIKKKITVHQILGWLRESGLVAWIPMPRIKNPAGGFYK